MSVSSPDRKSCSAPPQPWRGLARRRFDQRLEQAYVRFRLAENRTLIRVACVLGAVLSLFSTVRHGLEGSLVDGHLARIGLVFLGSVILAVVACTPLFGRLYLPAARIIVPIRNAVAAVFVTGLVAQGQLVALMVLPLMVVGPFFFLGLPFRTALVSVVTTIASFVVASLVSGLAVGATLSSCVFLLAVAVACVIAARHIDEGSRRSFLESRAIARHAERDSLTGIRNRRVFDEHFVGLWRRAVDGRRAIAVLLIDVDHFKVYNDRYGHQAGDRALQRVAATLQSFITRPLDMLARYGGEEFVVVLNDVETAQVVRVAESMRRAVSELPVESHGGQPVTISVGVAALRPAGDREPRGVLQLADQALYQAKIGGRNRVELMQEEDYHLLVTGIFSRSAGRGGQEFPGLASAAKSR